MMPLLLTLYVVAFMACGCRGLTEDEKSFMLDAHNNYRAMQNASNMMKMEWNSTLERSAQEWADTCTDAHSVASSEVHGENIYYSSAHHGHLTRAVEMWYNETENYIMATDTCTGQTCGHYTQLVWFESNQLGCGQSHCEKQNATFNSVVCQYAPGGNVYYNGKMDPAFLLGPACTKCPEGNAWCTEHGLCDATCTNTTAGCTCERTCKNCGTLNSATCECDCLQGFSGRECQTRCANRHVYCSSYPGWSMAMCATHKDIREWFCPLKCGTCQGPEDGQPSC